MKKMMCFVLAMLLAASLAGCGQTPAPAESAPAQAAVAQRFTAANEIVTYERIDPEKTQLIVARIGNVAVESFCEAFEARNPDVQIVYQDITGGNDSWRPAAQWLQHGYAPDVMVYTGGFLSNAEIVEYFENLSADPIIANYEADALRRTAVEANVYTLPGPSSINAMIYNKTLFTQYGWEVPNTFDEFVALCLKIREDTNGAVEPWNPNAKYSGELLIATEAFVYEELFGGAENRAWYNDFTKGSATFAGHMEPYYEMLQTLIDNGLLREEHFSYSATTRGKEFEEGKIAMINVAISDCDNDDYDFSYMPFPTTQGELGYINDLYSCYLSLPKKEHTAAQQDAVKRFVEYFSSVEGQQVFIGNSLKVSNIKGVPLLAEGDLVALSPAISAGHLFDKLTFKTAKNLTEPRLHQDALDMTTGLKTAAECIADVDKRAQSPAAQESAAQPAEIVAVAEQEMTILETSFYIADMYREAAEADIGLIVNNEPFRGNLMRVFSGELTPDFVTVLKPRSFENGSTLVKLSMTGAQLLDALNHPVGNNSVSNSVYAFSGLNCTVAPWNTPGEKILSVTLADGSELEPDKHYTVAAWAGTVAEEDITETLETYEGTWEELMTAKMKADGTLAPANDSRITLVWE